jgi:LysM repeat protein
MPARRIVPLILINILISAGVVLAILFWWDGREPEAAETVAVQLTSAPIAQTIEPAAESVQEAQPPQAVNDEEGPVVHVVQTGDTLGSISVEYDVTVGDIMSVNGLEDPNFLQVGQELLIPVGGIPTATSPPTETPAPAVTPSPISTGLPAEGESIVAIAGVNAAGLLAEESVSVSNEGTRPISLLGWRLQDAGGSAYVFGQVTLFGEGAAIQVHTRAGQDGPADLFWGLEEAVWASGATVTLLDGEGTVRSTFVVDGS